MGSFRSHTFGEYGEGAGGPYGAWPAGAGAVEKDRPADTSIVQLIGADVPRFNLVVRVTKAELQALYDDVLETGSLVFGYETTDALLCAIPEAAEQGAGQDVYLATLDVIRL
jgi:hypothetical protein